MVCWDYLSLKLNFCCKIANKRLVLVLQASTNEGISLGNIIFQDMCFYIHIHMSFMF